jgi:hypothetical protein
MRRAACLEGKKGALNLIKGQTRDARSTRRLEDHLILSRYFTYKTFFPIFTKSRM